MQLFKKYKVNASNYSAEIDALHKCIDGVRVEIMAEHKQYSMNSLGARQASNQIFEVVDSVVHLISNDFLSFFCWYLNNNDIFNIICCQGTKQIGIQNLMMHVQELKVKMINSFFT